MPYTATHILIPILLISILRDFYLKKRSKANFPLHYALIAGLAGVLPDIDILLSIILNLAGVQAWDIHKTFTHSLFFPLVFLVLFLVLIPVHKKARICNLTRHKLKLSIILLMISIGIASHILLDAIFGNYAFFLYPFSSHDFGLNIINYLPKVLEELAFPLLDGILVVIWIFYLEIKHKISDFI